MAQNNNNNDVQEPGNPENGLTTDWEERARLAESITDASIDSMVALDRNLRIISWNDIACIWSGKSSEEVMGKAFFEVFPNAMATPGLHDGIKKALEGLKSFLPSTPDFYLTGYFETYLVPLKDNSGAITGVLQLIHDVSHRIKAENELKELNHQLCTQNRALQHANEEMATFAKIAAHDLKEPLRKIYTFAELIKVQEAALFSYKAKSYFRSIQKSVQRMGLLTDDIVNFLSLNRSGETFTEVDLSTILAEVIAEFRLEIADKNAEITNTMLFRINGYPKAIKQLFTQLISNALKFQERDNKPRIEIGCEKVESDVIPFAERGQHEQYYCLIFRDNGIGFEPEYSHRIFGLFERLHPQGTFRGSGMGLAIALKAARMHEGFMKAESEPGKGSTFYCYLPVSKSD